MGVAAASPAGINGDGHRLVGVAQASQTGLPGAEIEDILKAISTLGRDSKIAKRPPRWTVLFPDWGTSIKYPDWIWRMSPQKRRQFTRFVDFLQRKPEWACQVAEELEKWEMPLDAIHKAELELIAAENYGAPAKDTKSIADQANELGAKLMLKATVAACR